jgi:hypothetical protein
MNTNQESQAAVYEIRRLAPGQGCALATVAPADLMPIYVQLFPRQRLRELLAGGPRLYWRVLSPMILLWGLIFQRLHHDHTCDAALAYLHSGAADRLDQEDRHALPLSQRLRSENTSAYVQGRKRLPLGLIEQAMRWVGLQVAGWLRQRAEADSRLNYHGRAVRVLDGTTFRMRPFGDLAQTYQQSKNQDGLSYWVVAKSLASFCLHSQVCIGYAVSSQQSSEPAMFSTVLQQDPQPHSLYIADQGLGVYRVAQVARHAGHDVLLRLERRVAKRLLRTSGVSEPLASGHEAAVVWHPAPTTVCEPGLAIEPIPGRLIYVHLAPTGFRPCDVYLFTSLLEADLDPLAELCALYRQRWRAELNYRHIKRTLQMAEFDVQSAAMFRKELAVGLLTYNLVCALMTQAACQAGLLGPNQLSFSQCLRRIEMALSLGCSTPGLNQDDPFRSLLTRLALCRLPHQPAKVAHEPRLVRQRWHAYGALHGDRNSARQRLYKDVA